MQKLQIRNFVDTEISRLTLHVAVTCVLKLIGLIAACLYMYMYSSTGPIALNRSAWI